MFWIRTIWEYFAGYRRQIILAIALAGTFSLLEGVGIAFIQPIIELAAGEGASESLTTRLLSQALNGLGLSMTITTAIGAVMVLFLVKSVLQYLSIYLPMVYAQEQRTEAINRLFQSFGQSPWEYYLSHPSGALLNTTLYETSNASLFLIQGVLIASHAISAVVFIGIALVVAPQLMAVAMVFLMLAGVLVAFTAPRIKRLGDEVVQSNRSIASTLSQFLNGYKTLRTYSAFDRAASIVDKEVRRRANAHIRMRRINAAVTSGSELALLLLVLAILYVAVAVLDSPLAAVGVIAVLMLRIVQRVRNTQDVAQLGEYLPSIIDVMETTRGFSAERMDPWSGKPVSSFRELKFSHVSFSYRSRRSEPALQDVDLRIDRGTMLGVVGRSGAGKSTLVGLLLGLLQPTEGEVSVDGTPLMHLRSHDWLAQIGYVAQEPFLVDGTIRENIEFFRDIGDSDLRHAAGLAHASDFIEELPAGYETRVGDRGIQLSGGERQRVCLARALAGQPNLLILDEATSALDSESEQAIQRSVEDLRHRITIVSIAHRLSTIESADEIIVLERGRVIERGTPGDLLDRPSGTFRRMYELQSIQS